MGNSKIESVDYEQYQELEHIIDEQTLFSIASRRPFEVAYETKDALEKDSGNTSYTFSDFKKNYVNTILEDYTHARKGCGNHNAQYYALNMFYRKVFGDELDVSAVKNHLTGGKQQ